MPRKYQGALAGLGLISGLAIASNGAGTSMAQASKIASQTRAYTNSRRTRCGMVVTRSVRGVSVSPSSLGMVSPPSLRTRQKCSDISITMDSGMRLMCSE